MDVRQIVETASVWVIPVLIAITFHEAAHGFVAWRLGDNTAYLRGRVTFNPLRHIDPVGTIILPAALLLLRVPFLFGWAKPVPVAFHRLNNPRRDMVLVAAAGPGINFALAVCAALLFNFARWVPGEAGNWLMQNLHNMIYINILLAIFNMLPLPPLDGGRVAVGLLPKELAYPLARLERYGLGIILLAIFVLPFVGRQLGVDLNVFYWIVWVPMQWMMPFFAALANLF
ncbi:MAG: site-2 protease family protein [Kiloniellales bacterium]